MKMQNAPWHSGLSYATIAVLLCATMVGCSKKNSGPDIFIKAGSVKVTATDINGCTLSNGSKGSEFNYTISYTTSPGITIEKVEYKSKHSSGTTNSGQYSVQGDGTDGNIEAYACIRFASSTWIEHNYTLVSTDGVKSNPVTLKINKPAGAP